MLLKILENRGWIYAYLWGVFSLKFIIINAQKIEK